MPQQNTFIYSLSHNDVIRYVGKANNLKNRLYKHLHCKRDTHCSNWINKAIRNGVKIKIEEIDEVSMSGWGFWEKYYISLFKSWGFDLTNRHEGGNGSSYLSESVRSRLSKQRMGKGNPQYGKPKSFEIKRKISETKKEQYKEGILFTEDHLRNIRIANSANKGYCSKKVIQYSIDNKFIKVWDSGMDVRRQLGLHVHKCCGGKRKTCGGFIWKYKN